MLERGINLAPSKYEAWFITTAHTEQDIKDTLVAVEDAFKHLKTRIRHPEQELYAPVFYSFKQRVRFWSFS